MITKHYEIKTYSYGDVHVAVCINYDDQQISLLEKDQQNSIVGHPKYKDKHWIFVKRGLEFMNGWRLVLTAMNYAIDEAEKELKDYIKMKEKEKTDMVTDVLMEATGIVKSRSQKRRIAEQKKRK